MVSIASIWSAVEVEAAGEVEGESAARGAYLELSSRPLNRCSPHPTGMISTCITYVRSSYSIVKKIP